MSVEELQNKINSKFGADIMFSPSQNLGIRTIPRFSTGSLSLDISIGGGWPGNRVVEVFGPESSGKTLLLYKAIAVVTNLPASSEFSNKALLIDEEGSYDSDWGKLCGINEDNLSVVRSDYAEQSLDALEMAVQSGDFGLAGLDSIAALIPKEELDASTEDWQMALSARIMSKACRKLYRAMNQARRADKAVTVFLINQIRFKVGRVFGNPETTPGGMGPRFASSVRMSLKRDEMLKDGEDVYGQRSFYHIVKNKTAPPLKTGFLDFIVAGDAKGTVDNHQALLDWAIHLGLITKSGSWFDGSLLPKKLQGEEKVLNALKQLKPKELNEVITQIEKVALQGGKVQFRFSV